MSSSGCTNGYNGVPTMTAAAGGRFAQRPPRTAIAADGAVSCCRAVLFHLVAVARRCDRVAFLRATRHRPVLVPPNSNRRSGLAVHVLALGRPTTLSAARLGGWTARGSIGAAREKKGIDAERDLQCELRVVCSMAIKQTALECSHYSADSRFGGARRSRRDTAALVCHGGGVSFVGSVECLL